MTSQWLLAVFGGALLFRIRGGLGGRKLGTDTTEARAIFALGMGLTGWWLGRDSWLLLLLSAWFLSCLPGWFGALGLGHDGTSWAADAGWLLLRGLMWAAAPALVLWWCGFSPWPLIAAGALCPLAYEVGYRIPLKITGLTQGPEIGEATFGALLGAGMAWGILA